MSEPLQPNEITGQALDKPIVLKGKSVGVGDLTINRTPYMLEKHEFFVIKKSVTDANEWAKRFLQISVGASINIVGKIIFILSNLTNPNKTKEELNIIASWELLPPAIALSCYGIAKLVAKFSKGERKNLMAEIENHFKVN